MRFKYRPNYRSERYVYVHSKKFSNLLSETIARNDIYINIINKKKTKIKVENN